MTRTVAGFAYSDSVSTLIAGFKYRAALQHGRVLGELLIAQLREQYASDELPRVLVPVPLHPDRLRERGFNQALVLARQVGSALQIPVADTLFARIRQTPAQQGLSAKERKRNLRGAFELQAEVSALRSIALMDDVVTTMSTMRELARVLRQECSQIEIHAWCLARA